MAPLMTKLKPLKNLDYLGSLALAYFRKGGTLKAIEF